MGERASRKSPLLPRWAQMSAAARHEFALQCDAVQRQLKAEAAERREADG